MTSEIKVCDERLLLHAERAIGWPDRNLLVIADSHFGKDQVFRRAGIPVPRGSTPEMLLRLSQLLERTGAKRLLVLGDLWHASSGISPEVDQQIQAWRRQFPDVHWQLVPGNHDHDIVNFAERWNLELLASVVPEPPFVWTHEPRQLSNKDGGGLYPIGGHDHPAVRLQAPGFPAHRLPCFWFGPHFAILPAFNRFTGLSPLASAPGDRVGVIADSEVIIMEDVWT